MSLSSHSELICVVDDDAAMREVLSNLLLNEGFRVESFSTVMDFLDWFKDGATPCDLIISDCAMPGFSGYDLCRRIRSIESLERIPIILVTGPDEGEKATGLEAGADDFTNKPVHPRELLAKVRSLLDIHAQEIITLSALGAARERNEMLSGRLERERLRAHRLGRLTRFVSPQVANLLTTDPDGLSLRPHRAEVTVMFIDLRGFTRFSEIAEPEEVMRVLGEYYRIVGNKSLECRATLASLSGDGVMVFLNDPEPVDDHQKRATEMAIMIRDALLVARESWLARGHDIGFGIGIAEGTATIGEIGFERFWQYSVIGPVSNLAARLCQSARHSQILVSHRFLFHCGENHFITESVGELGLKGMTKTVRTLNIVDRRKP